MLATARPRLTYDEYCVIEAEGRVKHEYWDGQAWAMAGGSRAHAAICANILGLLTAQLRGGPCQAHTSDLRVRVVATGLATYPDVSVLCGHADLDPEDRYGHAVTNPTLLVEVLSPSTEEYDRGEKLAQYRQIASLKEVVLVTQDARFIEVWSRGADGTLDANGAPGGERQPCVHRLRPAAGRCLRGSAVGVAVRRCARRHKVAPTKRNR